MALDNNQIENLNNDNDEISLKELIIKIKEWFAFLKSKWKIIFFAGVIGATIGFIIAYNDKVTYKATLTFAMEDEKGGGLSGAAGLASSLGFDIGGVSGGGGAFASSNLAELMKSRLIIEKVLLTPIQFENKVTTLAELYINIYKLRDAWGKNPKLKTINFFPGLDRSKFSYLQDSILKQLHKNLTGVENLSIMQKDKKTSILSIEVKSENELFSKIFCETLARETSDFYIDTKSKKARINVNVLQRQTDSVRNSLNMAITGVANETDIVYNLNPSFNIKTAPSKKRQIDVQANTAILTNLVVQLELAKITLRKETPLIQVIDRPILPLEKEKYGKLNFLVLGGIIASLLTAFYLILSKLFNKILS